MTTVWYQGGLGATGASGPVSSVLPLVYGTTRVNGVVVFQPREYMSATAAVGMIAACEGPISSFGSVWKDDQKTATLDQLGLTPFLGGSPQTPWSWFDTPSHAYYFWTTVVGPTRIVNVPGSGPLYQRDLGVTWADPSTGKGYYLKSTAYGSGPFDYGMGEGTYLFFDSKWIGRTLTFVYVSNAGPGGGVWTLGYGSTAYVAGSALPATAAGISAGAWKFEVQGLYASSRGDVSPADVATDLLTHPVRGCGLAAGRVADLTQYRNYVGAMGLHVSWAITEQASAIEHLGKLTDATNSGAVWTGGQVKILPFGDVDVAANGFTFTANATPVYDIGPDDFIVGSPTDDPITVERTSQQDTFNTFPIEFLDAMEKVRLDDGKSAGNAYQPTVVEDPEVADVDVYGLRKADATTLHCFSKREPALIISRIKAKRSVYVRNRYKFKLGWKYILLEPMDLITISEPTIGIGPKVVRLLEVEEDNGGESINIVAEEWPFGVAHATAYDTQTGDMTNNAGSDITPARVHDPIIFSPPTEATGFNREVWMAAASGDPNWAGAEVWTSYDQTVWTHVGSVGKASYGSIQALLPSGAALDTTNTVHVDPGLSGGLLPAGSVAERDALNTLCYVDGELISYGSAVWQTDGTYHVTSLKRGLYGSTISAHSAGTLFALINSGVFRMPVPADMAGQTIYVKFRGYNLSGKGQEDLANLGAYTFAVPGNATTNSAPANPTIAISTTRPTSSATRFMPDFDQIAAISGTTIENPVYATAGWDFTANLPVGLLESFDVVLSKSSTDPTDAQYQVEHPVMVGPTIRSAVWNLGPGSGTIYAHVRANYRNKAQSAWVTSTSVNVTRTVVEITKTDLSNAIDDAVTTRLLAPLAVTATELANATIPGSKLQAEAIGARELAALSITAKHLTVTDFENLWPNGNSELAPPTGAATDGAEFQYRSTADFYAGTASRLVPAGFSLGNSVPCQEGEQFYLSVMAKGFSQIGLYFYNAAGTQIGASATAGTTYASWTLVSVSGTAPANTVRVLASLMSGGTAGSYDNIFFRKKNAGSLIVDGTIEAAHIKAGAITTSHMTAGTIDGDRIQAGTLNADRIEATSITADRFAADSLTTKGYAYSGTVGTTSEVATAGAKLQRATGGVSAILTCKDGLKVGANTLEQMLAVMAASNFIPFSFPTTYGYSIAEGPTGRLVAVAGPNNGATSDNGGRTWTARTLVPTLSGGWYGDVCYGGPRGYLAVGYNGAGYSSNGETWTSTAIGTGMWTRVVWNGTCYLAIDSTNGSTQVARSTDGITWTKPTIAAQGFRYAMEYGGGKFVTTSFISGTGVGISYSTDGISWSTATVPSNSPSYGGYNVGYSADLGLWTIITLVGGGWTSPDGVNWTAYYHTLPDEFIVHSIRWGGHVFLAGGYVNDGGTDAALAVSTDGVNWRLVDGGALQSIGKIIYSQGAYGSATRFIFGGRAKSAATDPSGGCTLILQP